MTETAPPARRPRKRRRSQRPAEGHARPRARSDSKAPSRARSRGPLRHGFKLGLLGLALVGTLFVVSFWAWAKSEGPGTGKRVHYDVRADSPPDEIARELHERGVVSSPRLFALYLRLGSGRPSPGPHLLRDNLSARELAQRLGRLPGRAKVKLTFPEGWNHLQMAERLEQREVVGAEAFKAAARSPELLEALAIRGPTAEGRLFPATYELFVDSAPENVVRLLVEEARKRIGRLMMERSAAFDELQQTLGFGEFEILTLASIVEKEAQDPDERPLIASVFFNRLSDPTFRPARMLQSDPTAAYGCLVAPSEAPSCAEYAGRVTPAMVRDAGNPYNTYKHAGLPPGPIANPGEKAILAVLEPAKTDFLYFVTRGGGRHAFTRTFAEHRQVIDAQRP